MSCLPRCPGLSWDIPGFRDIQDMDIMGSWGCLGVSWTVLGHPRFQGYSGHGHHGSVWGCPGMSRTVLEHPKFQGYPGHGIMYVPRFIDIQDM